MITIQHFVIGFLLVGVGAVMASKENRDAISGVVDEAN